VKRRCVDCKTKKFCMKGSASEGIPGPICIECWRPRLLAKGEDPVAVDYAVMLVKWAAGIGPKPPDDVLFAAREHALKTRMS
jgi:hypothetical protein